MSNTTGISRRTALAALTGAAGLAVSGPGQGQDSPQAIPSLKGRVHHSVCRWCYRDIELEDLCKNAAAMGIASVELLNPEEWPIARKHGLTCAMANGPGGISDGWNTLENHDGLVERGEKRLAEVAGAGLPNMIVFSGNRRGMPDEQGLENCVKGLLRILPLAERLKVTVCMELLNSKVDHKDYMCDHTPWGVELVKRVGSERFKLLYDIYHMQIMEGDVVRTIRESKDYIGHYHTGGVPGRNEIDETQELNYAFVLQAIVDTGFQGFVAQEFIPKLDPMTSLARAVQLCDV
ncbi:MAG: TIM barrel protein [Candidatus Omnitrophica bacterium]|nr:hypothetical protein [bacterium]NUN97976.1 TIM barrel protein [Candidatus Omnitrophota bacterium]